MAVAGAEATREPAIVSTKPTFGMRLGKTVDRWLLPLYVLFVVLYLILPVVIMIVFSFNDPTGRSNLTWKSWGSGSAWGTGKLWTQKPGCSPSYKCAYYSRWAGVYLSTVRWHNGVRYYARMAIEFFVSGKARWVVGWYPHYNCPGCSAFWGFPLVWPYF